MILIRFKLYSATLFPLYGHSSIKSLMTGCHISMYVCVYVECASVFGMQMKPGMCVPEFRFDLIVKL